MGAQEEKMEALNAFPCSSLRPFPVPFSPFPSFNSKGTSEVISALTSSAAYQALEGDRRVPSLLERYRIPPEGRMNFEQVYKSVLYAYCAWY